MAKRPPATKRRGERVATSGEAKKFSLLDEPLLGLELADRARTRVSLPECLALLGRDEVRCFTAMQAHQQHGWHAFLVQLAAIALHKGGAEEPRQRAERWRELLLGLTRTVEPWCLVVEDLTRPAFMQPPVPERTLEGFKDAQRFPDELDVLVTAKNHDVKAARIGSPQPEHWIYALVTLQTMEGFSGKANYGIARMNGGHASRPVIGLTTGSSLGVRFRRDVGLLLAARTEIARSYEFRRAGGKSLLWCEQWDGEASLALGELDPFFIDVCRRVRMAWADERLTAMRTGTSTPRVAAQALQGNTGDPWTPVNAKEGKAFTATEAGFSYRTVQRLLTEYPPCRAMVPQPREGDVQLLATVFARGMGKTAGFHERTIPFPRVVTNRLRREDSRNELARLARERVELVSLVQNRALRPALRTLVQGAPDKLDMDDDRADRWVRAHDAAIDAVFFERLWADVDGDPAATAAEWARLVLDLAREQLHAAMDDAPVPLARRYRAVATAERVFEGAARNHVSIAFPPREVNHGE